MSEDFVAKELRMKVKEVEEFLDRRGRLSNPVTIANETLDAERLYEAYETVKRVTKEKK